MIEPRFTATQSAGPPPKTEMHRVVNALLYIVRTRCQRRQLPREFPPYTTVQRYFYAWRDGGILDRIDFKLLLHAREAVRREPSPSARIIDSQSVKTTEAGGPRGFRCREANQIVASATSLPTRRALVGAEVHPADIQDCDGASLVILPPFTTSFSGYAMSSPTAPMSAITCASAKKIGNWTIEIVRRMAGTVGFEILPRRGVVERTVAWLNRNRRLTKDFEATIASAKAWLYLASVQLLIKRLACA